MPFSGKRAKARSRIRANIRSGGVMRQFKIVLGGLFILLVCLTTIHALQQTSGTATKTSAAILKLDDLGMVAASKSADFVVLDANPLDDIKNTRRISKVYIRGKEVDRAAMRREWGSGS